MRARMSASCAGVRVRRPVTELRTPSAEPTSADHVVAGGDADQLHEVHPGLGRLTGEHVGDPGLAQAARPEDRDQPCGADQRPQSSARSSLRPSRSSASYCTPLRTGSSAASSSRWSRCRVGSGSTPRRSATSAR